MATIGLKMATTMTQPAMIGLPSPAASPKPLPTPTMEGHVRTQNCPGCGTRVQAGAEEMEMSRKIMELEAQMEVLKEKATAAVDRCADYEDQLRTLTLSKQHPHLLRSNTSISLPEAALRPSTSDGPPSRFSFFPSLPRRPSANPLPVPPKDTTNTPLDLNLLHELERERTLRAKAEARVQSVDVEIEELSVQLFSQANEMVAEERKARAKLEERVETLERRDREKMGRLERLEKAVTRVERVKALLKEQEEKGMVKQEGAKEGERLKPPARR